MERINASIITIGDELLIGQTIDTNSAFIARELNKIGIWVRHRLAVGDDYDAIWEALDKEKVDTDLIIITGGLGPTADDITKPLLCKYFGAKLVMNEDVRKHVEYLFEKVYRRPGPLLERNLKQAEVPDNCIVLHNAWGTAPGMWFEKERDKRKQIVVSLPGVPHEMKGIMTDTLIPRLKDALPLPAIVHRTAFTAGQGESLLAESLKELEDSLPAHIKLAYLPNYGMVKLRLTARGDNKKDLQKELEPIFLEMVEKVRPWLVAEEDTGLESVVGQLLRSRNKTMATAESCTGGYIAHLVTSIEGSSSYYNGTLVCYSNKIKESLLGVRASTLKQHGAVSRETVTEMVTGTLAKLDSDYALATSGIMGPGGGSEEKPVGTVWIAAGNRNHIETLQLQLRFDRQRNISLTAMHALNFLRKFIISQEDKT